MDSLVVFSITRIAERMLEVYSSRVTFGLAGCSLAQIVYNLGTTLRLLPSTD